MTDSATPSECLVGAKQFRTRKFSWRIFRYVLKDFLVILSCVVVGFLLFTLVFDLMDDLSDFDNRTVNGAEVATYFLCLLPEKIKYIVPMSMLLASMWVLANMSKQNEITALRAMGVSILQAFIPFIIIALIFSGVMLFCSEYLAPLASEKAKFILRSARHPGQQEVAIPKPRLAFRNNASNRDWLLREIDRDGNAKDIFIQQFNDEKNVVWEMQAKSASFDQQTGEWIFDDVTMTVFPTDKAFPQTSKFEQYRASEFEENPKSIRFFANMSVLEELSALEIIQLLRDKTIDMPKATRNILWTSLAFRLSFPLSCVISVLLGVPLAITTRRTGAMKSILKAVGIMASFYVVSQVFVVFGNNPRSNAVLSMLAGCIPVLLYIIWGARELKKQL